VNDNPPGNSLPGYASEPKIKEAILASGLPVQARVASLLVGRFTVDEEWAFVDRQEGKLRTLDLHAAIGGQKPMIGRVQPRADPVVDLLIECKQSTSPYVFLRGRAGIGRLHVPMTAGLPSDQIQIGMDRTQSIYSVPVVEALGLDKHPFLTNPAPISRYLSRALPVKNGTSLDYGGGEAYSSTVEPLMSSLFYFRRHVKPIPTFQYFDCHAVFALCVLAAPMVLATAGDTDVELEMAPWVRLIREEADPSAHPFDRSQRYAIDYVHIDFLPMYIADNLLPFAVEYQRRVYARHRVLADGRGYLTEADVDEGQTFRNIRYVPQSKRLKASPFYLWRVVRFTLRDALMAGRLRSQARRNGPSRQAADDRRPLPSHRPRSAQRRRSRRRAASPGNLGQAVGRRS
jgi:hypothetical protein